MDLKQKKELLTDINNYIKLDKTMANGPSPGLLALKTQIEEELEDTNDKSYLHTRSDNNSQDTTNDNISYDTLSSIQIIRTIEEFFQLVNPYMKDFGEFMDELQEAMNEYQGFYKW